MGLAEELAEGLVDQEFAALVDAVFVVGFEAVTTTQTTMRRSSRSRGSLAKVRTLYSSRLPAARPQRRI